MEDHGQTAHNPLADRPEAAWVHELGARMISAQGGMSDHDMRKFAEVVLGTFEIYVQRDEVRQGLWKQGSARDQMKQVQFKVERVLDMLSRDEITPVLIEEIIKEGPDIINYTIFAMRLVHGRDSV